VQLYRGGKFTWRKNPQYHKRTTHQSPVIDKRQHQVASSKHRHGEIELTILVKKGQHLIYFQLICDCKPDGPKINFINR